MIKIKNNKVLIWEVIGMFFIIIFGSLFHFFYQWFDYSTLVGAFAPVNESVWEHLKLGFWSVIIFSIIEYWFIKDKIHNFLFAKAIGILALQLTVILIYYGYIFIFGKNMAFINILSYIIGAVICQLFSYKILVRRNLNKIFDWIGLLFIIVHAITLIIFTFFPPELPIFLDKTTNSYGIPTKNK